MAVNPKLNAFRGISSPRIVTGDSDLESSAVYTAPPCLFESLRGRSNRSLPRLPLNMQAEEIIPTLSTSNIYIGLCLPNAHTMARIRSYQLFRNNKCAGLWGILSFPLLRDAFPHQLARGIPRKEGVPLPLQSLVRTPPPHLR
jgi:hypothetical protein